MASRPPTTSGVPGKRSSTGGNSPAATLACSIGGSLRPLGTTTVTWTSFSMVAGVGVGATPQAVATVPTIVTADTFKKSRRLIFLLSISISFFLCFNYEIDLYLATTARYFIPILLYHLIYYKSSTFRTKYWIFRTGLAAQRWVVVAEAQTWLHCRILDVRQTHHIEFPIDGWDIQIQRMDSRSVRSLRAAARDHPARRDPANQRIMPRLARC